MNAIIHENEWRLLTELFSADKLPHALLFTGPVAAEKYDFALRFAKYILCQNSSTNGACGECKSCLLFAANNHPDFLLLEPEALGKQIKVDQVRVLIAKLTQTSHQSGYKAVIINPADALNIAASNALLKTLEEPIGRTSIILCSSNENKLAATVRSRCQTIRFASQSTNNILDQYDSNILNELLVDLNSLVSDEITPVAFAKNHAKKDQRQLIDLLQIICRNMFLLKLECHPDGFSSRMMGDEPSQKNSQLTKLVNYFNPQDLIKLFDLLIENKKLQENNINQELFLTEFALLFSRSRTC